MTEYEITQLYNNGKSCMTTKELLELYGKNYCAIKFCTGDCSDTSEFGCLKRKYRNQEIEKELEASIRKEVEDKLMRAWDDMEHKGIKFCENDDWRNYKFVRNSIRNIINN